MTLTCLNVSTSFRQANYAYNHPMNYQGDKMSGPVVVQMPNGEKPRWSWCSLVWSLISSFCCFSV